ncbi:hypothetical protein ACGFX8_34870 [Streptomyces sp. NPDC048362]|uniref:hypothetical protein n=1 Tax=Streptomyces sp. NPDC048362 TaxID=3365539 RepID=UPI003714E725
MSEPEHLPEREQSDRQEIVVAGRETIAEFRRAAVVRVVEQETGVTLVDRPPSIMDATREQIADALLRARHAVAAAETVLSVSWGESGTLGELMRDPIWTDAERERIVDNFIRTGIS